MILAALLLAPLQAATLEVAFEPISNRPYVEVSVDGRGPYRFCIDTGAAGDAVYLDLGVAREVGLEVGELARRRVGAGEGLAVEVGRAGAFTLGLGGRELRVARPAVLDLSALERFDGERTHGLLGRGFLEHWLVELDYPAQRLRLHDPDTRVVLERPAVDGVERPPRWRVPFELEQGFVVVRAGLTPSGGRPIEARFVVDTGARMVLVCHTPFVEAHDLLAPLESRVPFVIGHGAGGECLGSVVRASELRVGPDLVVGGLRVHLSQDRAGFLAGDAFDGILGGELLRRYRVFLDYRRRELVLEETARSHAPWEHDRSGLVLVAAGPALEAIHVRDVRPGSPAALGGVRAGDVLISCDGRAAGELGLAALRERLQRPGAHVELRLLRGAEPIEIALELEPADR